MRNCARNNGCDNTLCGAVCRTRFPLNHFTRVVSDLEIENPDFIRDVRILAASLGISPAGWRDFLADKLLAFEGIFIDAAWQRKTISLSALEASDSEIFDDLENDVDARILGWIKDTLCTAPSKDAVLHVRIEAHERFKTVATILRASFANEAMMWGVRAANDNSPLIPPSAQ